jgi:hypothetical protein
VDRAFRRFGAQQRDHPLDLPPVAKALNIAVVPTARRAHPGFALRRVTVGADQFVRIVQGGSSRDEEQVHRQAVSGIGFPGAPKDGVNGAFTIGPRAAFAYAAAMRRNSLSGGFFLFAAILVGFGFGVAWGDPLRGVLAGTAVGAVAALLLWLWDRRRAS